MVGVDFGVPESVHKAAVSSHPSTGHPEEREDGTVHGSQAGSLASNPRIRPTYLITTDGRGLRLRWGEQGG